MVNPLIGRSIALAGIAYSFLPLRGIARPLFILGCGRSGTTIFGTALSKHRKVTYLHEPRHLWFSAYPETDIWSKKAAARHGKLVLTAAHAEAKRTIRLRRLFRLETLKTMRPILVEKLPINNFRVQFIRTIFPDARFLHIYRNGLEVARSIEEESKKGRWFASNTYKWDQLSQLARGNNETAGLPELCTSYFDKGLLEWRLSTEAAVVSLQSMPKESFVEISYDELVDYPVRTMTRVLSFIGVGDDSNLMAFAHDNIVRRTPKLERKPPSEKEKAIGGELLLPSMDVQGLTQRVYTPA